MSPDATLGMSSPARSATPLLKPVFSLALVPQNSKITALADIEVEMLEFKAGRFVSDLQFSVRKKPQRVLALQQRSASEPVDVGVLASAERLGIDHSRIERLIEEFGDAAVAAGVEAVERRAASAFPEPLRDPLRYLKSVLPGHAAAQVEVLEKVETAKNAAAAPVPSSERLAQWEKRWLAERIETLAVEIAGLPSEQQAELVRDLQEALVQRNAHPAVIQRLVGKGWTHPMVRHEMVSFYATGAYGADWDKPSDKELLVVAAGSRI